MAFSRKARTALRKSRQGNTCPITAILKEGENAFRNGQPVSANPYDGEDAELWVEGWEDAKECL